MYFGHFSDNLIPRIKDNKLFKKENGYNLNSYGYRCPEWTPMPTGKKNVVVLGCSHTFGQGNQEDEHWVYFLSKYNTDRLRYWNLGVPGASADLIVRILYGAEKILNPEIVIVCWPVWSRRERLLDPFDDIRSLNLTSSDPLLKFENNDTDRQNFLKNVFFVEKYGEKNNCKIFHCFAQDSYHIYIQGGGVNVLEDYTISNCWPYWHKIEQRVLHTSPSLASDGMHFGIEHHKRFSQIFLQRFASKLK